MFETNYSLRESLPVSVASVGGSINNLLKVSLANVTSSLHTHNARATGTGTGTGTDVIQVPLMNFQVEVAALQVLGCGRALPRHETIAPRSMLFPN